MSKVAKLGELESMDEATEKRFEEEPDNFKILEAKMAEMQDKFNQFVNICRAENAKTIDLISAAVNVHQPVKATDGSAQNEADNRSTGFLKSMDKKVSDASLRDLVEAGDLALKVHDRRGGPDEFQQLMIDNAKEGFKNYLGAIGSRKGAADVTTN